MVKPVMIFTSRYLCSIPECTSEHVFHQQAPYFDTRHEFMGVSVPPGWRELNGQLVCPDHIIRVSITTKDGALPRTEMLL